MLYSFSDLPERQLERNVAAMSADDRRRLVLAYVGDRSNRRHKPGRALERTGYRFDVLSDYGAFRDLQRHRLLTIEWQDLTPDHGYVRPEAVDTAGCTSSFDEAMDRSARLYDDLAVEFPLQASYAVSMAYRVRYAMQFNAREAMHMIELRTTPQGHPSYRMVCQEMYRQIAKVAGHSAIAEMLSFVNLSEADDGRLEAERRAEARRERAGPDER